MLARIETIYLAILRVVVLVAATLALLVALYAALTALPALARQYGGLETEAAEGGTLGDYIAARKATVPAQETAGAPQEPVTNTIAPEHVNDAAKILQRYSKGVPGMTIPLWEKAVMDHTPDAEPQRYYDETLALVRQLDKATGKRLDTPGLKDMLAWNAERYQANLRIIEGRKAAETTAALFKLYVASIAFILFILVVFTFLFVKVERSLRVVRTVRIGETVDA